MPACPQCGKVWPDSHQRCPDDGSVLVPTQAPIGSSHGNAVPALAPVSADDLAAGSLAGEYRIERKIGEGGMGSVYGARHPLIGKKAAIKVINRALSTSQEAVDRFVLEAQSVNQIGHPNIVDVFGFGQLPDGRSFFVMEWLEGESLRERMLRPFTMGEALEILEAIAKALEAAHEAGVVHRDLKPDNVFLQARRGEKPQVKLLDFGLAKLTGQGDGQRFDRTRTGVVMGTPLYLSPEQAKGTKVDVATDVYSLGAMAYEMLAGDVPFKADSAVEIMAMHISVPATPLAQRAPWVSPELSALVTSMLDKNPAARPTTAQVREQLAVLREHARTSSPVLAASPLPHHTPAPFGPGAVLTPPPASHPPGAESSIVEAVPSRSGKRVALILLGIALAAGAVVAAVVLTRGSDKTSAVASTETSPVATTSTSTAAHDGTGSAAAGSDTVAAGSAVNTVTAAGSGSGAPSATAPAASPTGSGDVPVVSPPADKPPVDEPIADKPPADKPPLAKHPVEKPSAPKPPAATTGRVTVVIAGPRRAKLIVDGQVQGREAGGHVMLELPPGEHTIRVQSRGFSPAETKVRVEAGATRSVTLTLDKRRDVNSAPNPFDD